MPTEANYSIYKLKGEGYVQVTFIVVRGFMVVLCMAGVGAMAMPQHCYESAWQCRVNAMEM